MRTHLPITALLACCVAAAMAQSPDKTPKGLPSAVVPMGLGVNIHFVVPPERDVEMIAAAGFRFVRMDLEWARIEHEKGRYDFSGYTKLVDALAAHGIRPLFILDYGNRLYDESLSPHTEEGRQAFARFAAASAAEFQGRGVLWELWNEPNIQFWRPGPNVNDYMALAKAALPSLRRADPHATILAPATSRVDVTFLEPCFQQGLLALVDAVSVHPYRREPPETAARDYERLRSLIAQYAPKGKEKLPIVSGEWGYSAAGSTDERQGQFLARQFLTNLMNGIPLSIWYDWHDDGTDPKNAEHRFGTVTSDYHPKPAYLAAQTLTRELSGYQFVRRMPLSSSDDFAAVFGKDRAQKVALWTIGEPHDVSLPFRGSAATMTSINGETQTVTAKAGKLVVTLTGTPRYLTLRK